MSIEPDLEMPAIIPYQQAFYIESMLFNTTSALNSATIVEQCLHAFSVSGFSNEIVDEHTDTILDSIQNLVVQAAAISKYFWPPRNGKDNVHKRRGELLQEAFEINEQSILHDRELRNCIEHFDEKLDIYLSAEPIGIILPSIVTNFPIDNKVPHHPFRAYYTKVGVFEILGRRFEIQPILDEVARIHDKLVLSSLNGGRLFQQKSGLTNPSTPPASRARTQ